MIPFLIVETTLPPAIIAPPASKIAAMASAPAMVRAFDPTAGLTLLATSLAPILRAIYAPSTPASIIMELLVI